MNKGRLHKKSHKLFSELDNGINNLKIAKAKLEIYRQAILKKAFEGEFTKEWRENQTDLPATGELLAQFKEEKQKYYKPSDRYNRIETWSKTNPEGRWRKFSGEEIIALDKTNLDIFWLKDKSLTDLDNLPEPDILVNEIIENIEAGLENFRGIMDTLTGV